MQGETVVSTSPTLLANHCPTCRFNFNSAISSAVQPGVTINGGIESCPRCGSNVPIPDVVGLSIAGRPRFSLTNSPATRLLMSRLRKLDNEIYFAVGSHTPISCVWKMFKQGENIYLVSREFGGWKASFHKSGQDNIGFTSEAFDPIKGAEKAPPSRHFFTAHRNIAPIAHHVRVLRLTISVVSNVPSPIIRPMKAKQKKNLKLIQYESGRRNYVVELFYSHDHPNEYAETSFPEQKIIAMMAGRPNEYFSLVTDSGSSFLEDDIFIEAATFTKSVTGEHSRMRDQKLTFGVSQKNTFLVDIAEENSK